MKTDYRPAKTGGPAFPTSQWSNEPSEGLTIRDWLAGQALQGFCAKYGAGIDAGAAAAQAYDIADTMLKIRGQ